MINIESLLSFIHPLFFYLWKAKCWQKRLPVELQKKMVCQIGILVPHTQTLLYLGLSSFFLQIRNIGKYLFQGLVQFMSFLRMPIKYCNIKRIEFDKSIISTGIRENDSYLLPPLRISY